MLKSDCFSILHLLPSASRTSSMRSWLPDSSTERFERRYDDRQDHCGPQQVDSGSVCTEGLDLLELRLPAQIFVRKLALRYTSASHKALSN